MGRKSSAKSQTRPSSGNLASTPPEGPRRTFSPLLAVALIVVAAVVGVLVATRSAQTTPPESTAAMPAPVQPPADEPPPHAKFGPHKQNRLPPLPFDAMPARPMDVVRASYTFAAEHPEILGYVPCYCGCERQGHRGNDDCFVAARDANGDVTQWEPHGMT
jgi:hypothetical protein